MTARFDLPWWATCLALAALWGVAGAFAVALGAVAVPPGQLASVLWALGHPVDPALAGVATIVWEVRLPRVQLLNTHVTAASSAPSAERTVPPRSIRSPSASSRVTGTRPASRRTVLRCAAIGTPYRAASATAPPT